MLKRQRAASPTYFSETEDIIASANEPPNAKRQRLARHARMARDRISAEDGSSSEYLSGETYGQIVPADEMQVAAATPPAALNANAYKEVNSFLHDLHVEHQHRIIWGPSPLDHPPYTMQREPHTPSRSTLQSLVSSPAVGHSSSNKEDPSQPPHDWYEANNKLLRDLFFSRKNDTLSSP